MALLDLLIIFGVGVLQDALNTWYVRAVAQKRSLSATALSGTITLLGVLVVATVLSRPGQEAIGSVLAYAFGNSLGTYLTLRKA